MVLIWLLLPAPQGIIGAGYERMLASNSKATDFIGLEEEYRMAKYFDTNHLHNRSAAAPLVAPLHGHVNLHARLVDRSHAGSLL